MNAHAKSANGITSLSKRCRWFWGKGVQKESGSVSKYVLVVLVLYILLPKMIVLVTVNLLVET